MWIVPFSIRPRSRGSLPLPNRFAGPASLYASVRAGAVVLVILLLFVGTVLRAEPESPDVEAERPLVFETETWDFGDVELNQECRHVFDLQNRGDAPVRIIRVRTTCGCADARAVPTQLRPGSKGKVIVDLDTRRPKSRGRVRLYVETDKGLYALNLVGSIASPPAPVAELRPRLPSAGLMVPGMVREVRVGIHNSGTRELTVRSSSVGQERGPLSWAGTPPEFPLVVHPAQEAELTLLYTVPETAEGLVQEPFAFSTDDPKAERLYGTVKSYVATPAEIRQVQRYLDTVVEDDEAGGD